MAAEPPALAVDARDRDHHSGPRRCAHRWEGQVRPAPPASPRMGVVTHLSRRARLALNLTRLLLVRLSRIRTPGREARQLHRARSPFAPGPSA